MSHLLSSLRAFLDRELEPLAQRTEKTSAPKQALPSEIGDLPLKSWDKAVFSSELVNLNIVPSVNLVGLDKGIAESKIGGGQVQEVCTSRDDFP